VLLEQLTRAAADRGTQPKLHVRDRDRSHVPAAWFDRWVPIARAGGAVEEPQAEVLVEAQLAVEYEWEDSPEVALAIADDVDDAVRLFNRYSPRFVLSLVTADEAERVHVERTADAPYTGNGFTRWVDGQYALDTPELGLSNWERGRLLGRSGILSGDAIHTVRSRAVQTDPDLHR
jgi:glutamate-5-semialdehyde dehydrogenase